MNLAKEHYELVTATSFPKQCWPQPFPSCSQGRSLHVLARTLPGPIALSGEAEECVTGACACTGLCGDPAVLPVAFYLGKMWFFQLLWL